MPLTRAERRRRLTAILARARVPGCAIVTVDARGVRSAEVFGVTDLTSGAPVALDTVWPLFSGTKLFTATAVLQAVERAELSLDHRLGEWLSWLPPVAADLSVREVLAHTSGLDDALRAVLAVRWPEEPLLSSRDALSAFPLRAGGLPRGRVRYRNVNYALLGALLTACTGVEYTELVARRLLASVHPSLTFLPTADVWARTATAYLDRWDPMRLGLRLLLPSVARRVFRERTGAHVALAPYRVATPAIGGLFGTVEGFASFLQQHLRGGDTLLTAASVGCMQRPVAYGAAGIVSREATGLGWKIGAADGERFLNHEGGGAGGTTELRLYPGRGVGVALAMNVMRMPGTMRVAHQLCSLVRDD